MSFELAPQTHRYYPVEYYCQLWILKFKYY